jgi:hypothetical protein
MRMAYQRSRSFRKLVKAVGDILVRLNHPLPAWPPAGWQPRNWSGIKGVRPFHASKKPAHSTTAVRSARANKLRTPDPPHGIWRSGKTPDPIRGI